VNASMGVNMHYMYDLINLFKEIKMYMKYTNNIYICTKENPLELTHITQWDREFLKKSQLWRDKVACTTLLYFNSDRTKSRTPHFIN
jgi:hypothetical protein